MKRCFLLAWATALLVSGCADSLAPEPTDRPPAAFSPDPAGHLPPQPSDVTGGRGGY